MNAAEVAARAWAFRYTVEVEAALRFDSIASRLESFDPTSPVVAMLRDAATDERRHIELCRVLAAPPLTTPTTVKPIAPDNASPRDVVLYEMIAACCIAETESVATLTLLLQHPMREDIERTVRTIAGDEVRHAKMGWAHLARESASRSLAFAAEWIPTMLAGSFHSDSDEGCAPAALHALGVLTPQEKDAVYRATLDEVVLPGLKRFGIAPTET